jgi:hypothetical protein
MSNGCQILYDLEDLLSKLTDRLSQLKMSKVQQKNSVRADQQTWFSVVTKITCSHSALLLSRTV